MFRLKHFHIHQAVNLLGDFVIFICTGTAECVVLFPAPLSVPAGRPKGINKIMKLLLNPVNGFLPSIFLHQSIYVEGWVQFPQAEPALQLPLSLPALRRSLQHRVPLLFTGNQPLPYGKAMKPLLQIIKYAPEKLLISRPLGFLGFLSGTASSLPRCQQEALGKGKQ